MYVSSIKILYIPSYKPTSRLGARSCMGSVHVGVPDTVTSIISGDECGNHSMPETTTIWGMVVTTHLSQYMDIVCLKVYHTTIVLQRLLMKEGLAPRDSSSKHYSRYMLSDPGLLFSLPVSCLSFSKI